MRLNKMVRIFFAVVALHLTVFDSVQALAKDVEAQKNMVAPTAEEQAHSLIEKFPTAYHAVMLVSALNKTTEPAQAIIADLRKNQALGKGAPVITFNKNKIFADGKDTGVSVVSYSPMTLQKDGAQWTYEKASPADKNYFDLKKFLNKSGDHAGLGSLLINQAHALGRTTTVGAAATAAVVVGVAGVVLLPLELILVTVAIAAATFVGTYGLLTMNDSRDKAAANALADFKDMSKVTVNCEQSPITFEAGKTKLRAARTLSKNPSDYILEGKSNGEAVYADNMNADLKKALVSLADACKEKSSKELNQALQDASKKVKMEIAENGSAKKSDPSKDMTSKAH